MTGGKAVVIGSTGRNFAAGMSGGSAFVFDEFDEFPSRCNLEMVGLERLEEPDDIEQVRDLLIQHAGYTKSTVAARLLGDWEWAVSRFIKVMPVDYRRVLDQQRQAARQREASRQVEVSGGKPTGFLETPRETHPYRPVAERINDFRQVYDPLPIVKVGEARRGCMDCGVPFCHQGCPLGNLIPDWSDLVYRDQWKLAIERLHATNNFPEFTGKLCPAPCEAACVLGLIDDPVAIKQIEESIADQAWEEGWIVPRRRRSRPARRSPWSAPDPPAWPSRSSSRGPATT